MQLTPEQHAVIDGRPGWCSRGKRDAIAGAIRRLRHRFPRELLQGVEIGVFGGQSLLASGFALQQFGGQITGVDPYALGDKAAQDWWAKCGQDNEKLHAELLEVIASSQLEGQVFVARKSSADYLAECPPRIHYLHIDGDHSEAGAMADGQNYFPHVSPGGFVLIDDADDNDWPGVRSLVKWAHERARLVSFCPKKTGVTSSWALFEVRANA